MSIRDCGDSYHLVYILYTEANPGGGWWFGDGQSGEADMITDLLRPYDEIVRKALTARIFVLSCGLNLRGHGVMRDISGAFAKRPWDSLLLPAATALYPQEVGSILPALFVHLFYMGTPLSSALKRTWLSSERAQHHTNWIVFEQHAKQNVGQNIDANAGTVSKTDSTLDEGGVVGVPAANHSKVSIHRFTWSSRALRPWGFVLPTPTSLCRCARGSSSPVRWVLQDSPLEKEHEERFVRFKTSCKHVLLRIAVCLEGASVLPAAGAELVTEAFDIESGKFPLDSPDAWHVEATKVSFIADARPSEDCSRASSRYSNLGMASKIEHASIMSRGRVEVNHW
ncbi:hypothetical protein FRC07_003281 [Ceratobasidium sp. 392]|nr:hypothetical protein FRC07_003281 [Ceratobasidium sp. 392]